ncbi:Crp/Fnr family transcriptional regulator [Geminocystis sp. NIES-3709]|uniref:Crp/Fnr family transcriptional regulator n=1 Tax=Geminocystis sp. NIES-3709 TaxID=1617448 RepID=UPI0005FC7789|nr:Crp/Fnr family transcriptional regulator [Geminocystis sp. NIES-3709]BAQ64781.1 cAMP-binding proteins - catabolite gene activator and regulatory subunit of cAMP-dependent protein kinases [Geminocystis sp. NIES-3709]
MTAMILRDAFSLTTLKQHQAIYQKRSLLPLRKDGFWQIQSGIVRTFRWLDDGTVVVFGLWGEGDIISPLVSKVNSFRIQCITDVKVSYLSLHQQTEINQGLINQAQELQELMAIKHYRPVNEALVQLLRWLGNKFGQQRKNGILIDVRLTHQEIAETIGTTRVTVTRLLTLFQQKGLIDRPNKHTIILKDI